jgi:Domain of unknown function (DUF4328)
MWICGDCRSANNAGQRQCYKCHVPRATGEMTEATAALTAARDTQARTVLAMATRLGARYRPTWPLAILVALLIVVATSMNITEVQAWAALVAPDGRFIADESRVHEFLTVSAATLAAYVVAVILWSVWIAIVVANVPALTARWPPNSPIGAFFGAFIPFINLKRPHSVVRGVLAILTEGRAWPRLLALAWWVGVLATYFAPTIVVLLSGSEVPVPLAVLTSLNARLALLIPTAILAVTLVVTIEREQRVAIRRRAEVVFGAPPPVAPDPLALPESTATATAAAATAAAATAPTADGPDAVTV